MVIIEFTYLLQPEQPLAHSSVSSYQTLFTSFKQSAYTYKKPVSHNSSSRYRLVHRGARQLGQITGITLFQIQ